MDDDAYNPQDDSPGMGAVVAPKRTPKKDRKGKGVPKWNVLLWDSDEHTYEYVMIMLKDLFGHADETCFKLAEEVHNRGKAVVLTTTQEHAELKRDQILAFGKDEGMRNCKGSMHSTIEQVD